MNFWFRAAFAAALLVLVGCPADSARGPNDAGPSTTVDAGASTPAADGGRTQDAGSSGHPQIDAALPNACRGHVCQAHASCQSEDGSPVCKCDAGYQDSDQNGTCVEDCNPSLCGEHGKCSAASGSPLCSCDPGWSGDSCATPDCAGLDCSGHGSCDIRDGVAACSCRLGWSGERCATPDCTGVTCSGQGHCEAAPSGALCLCDAGWTGAECASPDCASVSCNDNGSCSVSSGAARCTCASGWSGAECATPDCASVSCVHGSCDTHAGRAACTCPAGWSGADCATADCAALDCNHHGACDTGSGVAACSCALGWSGASCGTPDCTGITCAHGSCATGSGTAACVCDLNWTDAACTTPSCKGWSCNGHGACGTGAGAAACSCASGWSGAHCESADCSGLTCSGHGSCATSTGSAVCTCASGWSGADCATPSCAGIGCNGHGTCSTTSGSAACSCNAGWSGTDCDAPACGSISCFHGGTCSASSGSATCSCTQGWKGTDCTTADCTGISCSGHGSCGTGTGAAVCTCAPGWSGPDCATADCASISCSGHGTCGTGGGVAACSCSVGWTSADCATPTCAGVSCGAHSTCSTSSGAAVCACDSGFGGDLCDFEIVYGIDLPLRPDWRSASGVAYDVDHSSDPALFDRVAYRVQLDGTYVWVELAAFTSNRKKLGVPSDWTWDQTVTDLSVRTNSSALTAVSHSAGGKMEFWSDCYATGLNGVFDYEDDDDPSRPDCHGSMQLFDGQTTLFAINNWVGAGTDLDVGIGTNPQGAPDWTSMFNASSYAQRRLEIYVREESACSGVACNGHGSCDASSGAAVCTCNSGWSGSDCTVADCAGIDCSSHGSCNTGGGVAACSCSSGWSGFDCSTASCSGIACSGHGACGTGGGVAACSCASGWSGADCSSASCSGITCSGHGTCGTGGGVAACSCASGWSGADCSTPSCSGITCSGHGTCGTGGGVAACSCASGWSGADCSSASCSGITCSGHGTCGTGGGVAACSCASGWSGADCSTPDCTGITCVHGTCGTGSGVAQCACPAGWSGSACSTADCANVTCAAHQVCSTSSGTASCVCDSTHAGDSCEYALLYSLDIPDRANWATTSDVPYTVDNGATTGTFDRVAYRLTLDNTWVWVDAKAWTTDRTKLGVPTDWIWKQSLRDLNVRTNAPSLTPVTHTAGNIEFWSNCYATGLNGVFDWSDDTQGDDCYGSMQIFAATHTVFAINDWVTGSNPAIDLGIGDNTNGGHPDWTFEYNAPSFQQRHLDVYVRDVPTDCSVNPCEHGTCVPGAAATCTCSAGYAGGLCNTCADDYEDPDDDGICTPICITGACSSLYDARGLSTGVHTMRLRGLGDVPLYVDNNYDSGGWVLVGRGRENWAWDDQGRGTPSNIAVGIGTSSAFTPTYLSSAQIQRLIDRSPGPIDLKGTDVRFRRAASPSGDAYQEARIYFTNTTQWSWDFPTVVPAVDVTIALSPLGAGATRTGLNLYDTFGIGPDDHTRIFTWGWNNHNYLEGFAYGNSVGGGGNAAGNFLWQLGSEGRPLPYTEVYLRSPRCEATTCNGQGSCDDSSGAVVCSCNAAYSGNHCKSCATGYQDNDNNGTCTVACGPGVCTNPGEACSDSTGSVLCLPNGGTSCANALAHNPGATSGQYVIDPDGAGGNPGFVVTCDMTTNGGGWTLIDFQDFTDLTANGWSDPRVDDLSTCPWGPMLGGYGVFGANDYTARTYDLRGIPHSEAYVSLDYLALDSWDGEAGYVQADGYNLLATSYYYYTGSDLCGTSAYLDRYDHVESQVVNSSNTLLLEIWSTLDQDPYDESFGADNIKVMVR